MSEARALFALSRAASQRGADDEAMAYAAEVLALYRDLGTSSGCHGPYSGSDSDCTASANMPVRLRSSLTRWSSSGPSE